VLRFFVFNSAPRLHHSNKNKPKNGLLWIGKKKQPQRCKKIHLLRLPAVV